MYMQGLGAYYLKNGQPVSKLVVGDVMTFNVPGYSQVWLEQYQNGQLQFSGPMSLPMPPYTLQPRDVGTFTASVFKLNPGGQRSDNIGTDSVQVLPAQTAPAVLTMGPPLIQAVLAPGYTNPQTTASGAAILPSGVATPSAPPAVYVTTPGAPVDFGAPIDTGVPAPEIQQAGFGVSTLLLIGAGLYFVFGGKRRR